MMDILYLGSQSLTRQKLLNEVGIPFVTVLHKSDEKVIKGDMSLENYVMEIAKEKMSLLDLPDKTQDEKNYRYVLTADTLVYIVSSGLILGKPENKEDAKTMLASMRNEELEVMTGCCLHKVEYNNGDWIVVDRSIWSSGALVEFNVDEDLIEKFFVKAPISLVAAGSATIEGYGQLFFKKINGSYTAVLGLPLFELHQELKRMGFKF